jgi:SAM-dependent methyltransferase
MKEALFKKIMSLLELDAERHYDILDLGCGSGDLLGRISSSLSNDSTLVGIDSRSRPVFQAVASYPGIDFHQEKFVDSLSFSDATFDIVLSVDTLECIPNKTALVREVARVLRPRGIVLFAHWDWDTQVYSSRHKHLVRKFVAEFSDWQQDWMDTCDGQMGRRLWGLFQGGGIFRGTMEAFTLMETKFTKGQYGFDNIQRLASLVEVGRIDKNDYGLICDEMAALAESGEYFYSVTSYIYIGNKAHPPQRQRLL